MNMSLLSVERRALSSPPLDELAPILESGLLKNFNNVTVKVSPCADLRHPPWNLAASGICGNEKIADIGGPPYLHPFPNLSKKYNLLDIAKLVEMGGTGSMLGAGAGPFHVLGRNTELMPNVAWRPRVDGSLEMENLTRHAEIDDEEGIICHRTALRASTTDFGLMANLFCSNGEPGEVLHIVVQGRKGELNFPHAVQAILSNRYGPDYPISMGGVFRITRGKARVHVMPEFSQEALSTGADVNKWLKFYEFNAPLVCLTVFHSSDPGMDLRMEHTHCFSEHGDGGHYHEDTTPEIVEYEAYLNLAHSIWRIDRPPG
ncbi:MAG: hypothetical protein Q9227_008373 [Pyrenula ochraceoflavens]